MLTTAFVLIRIEERKVYETVKTLQKVKGITEIHLLTGEYDMVAVIRVRDSQDLGRIITGSILHAPGVLETKTLFSLESFSSYDLSEIYDSN